LIVLIGGFSKSRPEQRLRTLKEEVEKAFPEERIIIPDYFEKNSYGVIRQFLNRKRKISEYAAKVASESEIPKDEKPILIGYSMGGIIARYLVEKLKIQTKAVILVGTPNRGIKFKLWEKLLLKLLKVPCLEELMRIEKVLADVKKVPIQKYYFIGGKKDKRVPTWSSVPLGEDKKWFVVDCGHSALIPKSRKDIKNSAIPIVLKILREMQPPGCDFLFLKNLDFCYYEKR
jgi:pimeloyl-ACP methyl ester carboxylesterase